MTDAQKRARANYNAKCLPIQIRPLAEDSKLIREAAAAAGESLSAYIITAVKQRIENEKLGK